MNKLNIENTIVLRPHHLLCLPGYRGKNYNTNAKNNWDLISKMVEKHPNTKVKFYIGKDILCIKCPANTKEGAFCKEEYTKKLDEKVKKLLNLKAHTEYVYSKLVDQLKSILDEKKHAEICGDCTWRLSGLCNDTFKKVTEPFKK